jgi:hypothetical protein
MGTINSSDRMSNIVLLRDRVCVRDMCINTLHKGDYDDYDNNNNNNNFYYFVF